MKRVLTGLVLGGAVLAVPTVAGATPSPNGPGQPGAPTTTCGSPGATSTPGGSTSAQGSPFNGSGTSGGVYAGNPGTESVGHSNSPKSVSQYDIACFQVTTSG